MSLADYVVAYDEAVKKKDENEQYRIEKVVRRFGVTKPMLIVLVEAQKADVAVRR